MLTNKQMVDNGYSKTFRCCFDLLAKYADAVDEPATWDRCCTEAAEIYDQFKEQPFSPMVSQMLQAVFTEIGRLHDSGAERTEQTEKEKRYRFTLN